MTKRIFLAAGVYIGCALLHSCANGNFSSGGSPQPAKKEPNRAPATGIPGVETPTTVESDPKDVPNQINQLDKGDGEALCKGTDLVRNGNFEAGPTLFAGPIEFTSSYRPETGCRVTQGKYTPGASFTYTVNDDPGKCHIGYYPNVAGNTGKMLVVNLPAAGQGMQGFWCQNIKVTAGTTYEVSARMRTVAMTTQTSESKWTIDDTVFSKTFSPDGSWKLFTSKWKAEKDGEINLCGKNIDQNTESGDLAVDDIAFRVCR